MKPTLYADDLEGRKAKDRVAVRRLFWKALPGLLPRRCEDCDDNGRCNGKERGPHTANIHDCHTCGGVGFLYPDPPEWWTVRYNDAARRIEAHLADWELFCHEVWRVVGIIKDTE